MSDFYLQYMICYIGIVYVSMNEAACVLQTREKITPFNGAPLSASTRFHKHRVRRTIAKQQLCRRSDVSAYLATVKLELDPQVGVRVWVGCNAVTVCIHCWRNIPQFDFRILSTTIFVFITIIIIIIIIIAIISGGRETLHMAERKKIAVGEYSYHGQ